MSPYVFAAYEGRFNFITNFSVRWARRVVLLFPSLLHLLHLLRLVVPGRLYPGLPALPAPALLPRLPQHGRDAFVPSLPRPGASLLALPVGRGQLLDPGDYRRQLHQGV